jgi:signal transduction histidine kinase
MPQAGSSLVTEVVETRPGLRVTLQGREEDVAVWDSFLRHPGTEVSRPGTFAEALGTGPSMAVVFAEPEEARSLVSEIPDQPGSPVALFLAEGHGEHPCTELLRNLVLAKRDWQAAFDAMVDPVMVLDTDGRVRRANVALAGALGREVTSVKDQHYSSLLGPVAGSDDPIAAGLAQAKAATVEARYSHLPGVRLVTTSPLSDEEGRPRGVVAILKDVTVIREQQERMLLAGQLADVGHLAAGVAHEISTPLASISLRTESLLRNAEDPRLQAIDAFRNFARYLKTIEEEVFRCKRIIGALLDFSGGAADRVTEIDLNALAQRAADLVAHQVKVSGLELQLHLEPGLPSIPGDEGQIRRALLALLMNAMDATPRGGHVEIETRQGPAGRVSLTVRDDGVGIPQENVRHLFTPFFTTKPVGQGTGLGLAVCHGIATAHGGEIRVESRPGAGTRMTLDLPAGRMRPAGERPRG